MKDRIPLNPGRVKLTPVAGQVNTYDMVRADGAVEVGTPLNKATLLSDATASLYGLGAAAVPEDAFKMIPNRIGDIVKATVDLEAETGGKYLYCDGRGITRTAYPSLWEAIENKYALVVPGQIGQVALSYLGELRHIGPIVDATHMIIAGSYSAYLVDMTDGSCKLLANNIDWYYVGSIAGCINSSNELILCYSTGDRGYYRISIIDTQIGGTTFVMTADVTRNREFTPLSSTKATASGAILCARETGSYLSDYYIKIFSLTKTGITELWSSLKQNKDYRNYAIQSNLVITGAGYTLNKTVIGTGTAESVIATLDTYDGKIVGVSQQGKDNILVATDKQKLLLFRGLLGQRSELNLQELGRLLGPCTSLSFPEFMSMSGSNRHNYFEMIYNSVRVLCTLTDSDTQVHLVCEGKPFNVGITSAGNFTTVNGPPNTMAIYGVNATTAHQLPTQIDVPYRTYIKALPSIK